MKTKYILSLFIAFMTLNSCDDFLEVEPVEEVSITEQLSNKEGVLQALNGSYTIIRGFYTADNFFPYADYQSGNAAFSPNPPGINEFEVIPPQFIENTYNLEDDKTDSDFISFYTNAYQAINSINLILEFVDALPDASQEEINQIKAECLSLRAFTHFQLAKIYSQNYNFTSDASHLGIVYNTRALEAGIDFPSRETAATTFELLINDLTTADDLYTNNPALSYGESDSYFGKYSNKALLADVYLWMGQWQNAYDAANEVILTSGKELTTQENLLTEWQNNAQLSESLFYLTVSEGESSNSISGNFEFVEGNWGDYVASGDYVNLLNDNDIRKTELLQVESLNTLQDGIESEEEYYFSKKYSGPAVCVVYRLSEMYFIRAEAAARLNNQAQALADLNAIRTRAGLDELTSSPDLVNEILLEKRREFLFENKTYFDFVRTQQSITRDLGCLSSQCNISYPNPRMILPIPQSTIDVNPNIVQNESY